MVNIMDYTKATDHQLDIIFNHEFDLPTPLLVGLVTEMMNRRLFDGMIMKVAKRVTNTISRDELIQAAYLGIYQFTKRFKVGKQSLKQMLYIVIERRIKTLLQMKYYKNNFVNEQALNHELPVMLSANNVEKTVINKLTLQEQLSHLSDKQRNIVTMFLDGYSLRWIGEHIYQQETSAIRYQFKDALRRMNIHDYEIRTKERIS